MRTEMQQFSHGKHNEKTKARSICNSHNVSLNYTTQTQLVSLCGYYVRIFILALLLSAFFTFLSFFYIIISMLCFL